MAARRVTATEFARKLSSMLNAVRYQDHSLEVWRGREMIARVVPPGRPTGYPIERLNGLIAGLPKLGDTEAERFLIDLKRLDDSLVAPSDPWAS